MKGVKCGVSGEGGFSLLELLIAMSIIGILAIVAVPRFSSAIRIANTARIQSDLQTLNSAIVMYHAEKGSYPSNISTDLKEYIQDIDHVKPPKGECGLRDGSTIEISASEYTLSSDGKEALCQSRALGEFGRKE